MLILWHEGKGCVAAGVLSGPERMVLIFKALSLLGGDGLRDTMHQRSVSYKSPARHRRVGHRLNDEDD